MQYAVTRTWYVDADGPVEAIEATQDTQHAEVAARVVFNPGRPSVGKTPLDQRQAAKAIAEIISPAWALRGCPSSRTVAAEIGISHTSVAQVINGRRLAGWRVIKRILDHFDVSIQEAYAIWIASTDAAQEP